MSTPIADMVEKMLSGGIPPDMIVLAVRTAEQCSQPAVDETAERRRRWDRERKARDREEEKSTGIPPDAESALSILPSSSESQKEKKGKKERAGIVCPPDFHPTQTHYDYGERKKVPRPRVDHACDRMRNWSEANANRPVARKRDWGKALFHWIDTESEKGGPNGHGTGGFAAAKERLLACGAEYERQAGDRGPDEFPGGGECG